MAEESRAVFSALDQARTQLYHFKAIVIAGMGFFTDAYDLFCITAVTKLIGRLYFTDLAAPKPGKLPTAENAAVSGVALFGTLAGQLFFGWLGDKLGRKQVYGITLITMVGCAIASGLSLGSTSSSVIKTLCFFRFWLGFGIGGDYPLSAVIMSEYSNQKTRGAFIAAVFAMQGMGILFAGLVSMLVSGAFLLAYPAPPYSENKALSTQPEADFIWRLVLMFGAVPAALTFYWRMKMPETARYTALVEGNHKKAAADMARVLETEFDSLSVSEQQQQRRRQHDDEHHNNKQLQSYGLWSPEFVKRHGIHLLGTTSTWFLLDIAFYSLNLTQKDVYPASGIVHKATSMNAIEEMLQLSKAMTLIALFATVPGYWFTVFFIEKIGRFYIQLGGFLAMSVCMAFLGVNYGKLRGNKGSCDYDYCDGNPKLFIFLFGLSLFFANFGPNSTTFIVPAELFPARLRSTCHGISAAAGKAGAVIAAYVFQNKTKDMDPKQLKSVLIQLSIVNMIGFCFSFLVPETRGKSLEELSGEDKDIGAAGSNFNNNGERERSRVTEYELSQSQSQSQTRSQSGAREV